ncbi:MAG TPA: PAS domain S-box protein [Rariglobus sp.]
MDTFLQPSDEARVFRHALENVSAYVYIKDTRSRYVYANRATLGLFGVTAEELPGCDDSRFFPPDVVSRLREVDARVFKGERTAEEIDVADGPGGRRVYWEVKTPIPAGDGSGRIVGLLGISNDITERKLAEQRIRHLNRVYAILSDINQVIVREKNLPVLFQTACRIAVEKGLFRMAWIGLLEPDGQTIGSLASAGVVDGYLDNARINLRDSTRNTGPSARCLLSGEHTVCNDIARDPSFAPWREPALQRGYRSSAAFPLKIAGHTVGVFNLYSDETGFFDDKELTLLDELAIDIGFAMEIHRREIERQRAEQNLRASERQFASTFESAPIGMALISLDRRWLKVNHALCHMLGCTAADLCGRPVAETLADEDIPLVQKQAARLLGGEIESYQLDKTYLRRDGTRVSAHVDASLLRDDHGRPVHFITQILDITEHRRLEEQFRQAQKMEAIGVLAGGVAHDFNNILGAMLMQTELAAMPADIPAETRAGLKNLRLWAERAAALTRQLLLFSRKQVMQPRNVDVNELVGNIAKMLKRIIGEDVRLQLSLHPSSLPTLADPGMLDQVLMNLAVNARDAMPLGGTLTVETTRVKADASQLRAHPEADPGDYVRLSVTDTGDGIPPDVLPHIFEPFFTTKKQGKGTGLGLATVFGIAKQHRGWIDVESPPGFGATFRIYLPLALSMPTRTDTPAPFPAPHGGRETILVCEDDPAVRSLIRTVLEQAGYRIHEAAHGAEACERWREHQADITLLITDLVMPGGMSGAELRRILQKEDPFLHVLMISGYSPEFNGSPLDLRHGEHFLQKPFAPDQLLRSVRACLEN